MFERGKSSGFVPELFVDTFLLIAHGGDDLLYTKRQQTGTDDHAEHRSDDGRLDKYKHSDKNEQNAGDHLRVIIVYADGGIDLEAAQISGDQ